MSLFPNKIKDSSYGDVCCIAKQTHLSFSNSDSKASKFFDPIHCDILGAYRMPWFCRDYYCLSIMNDASRTTWVFLMKEKREASQLIKDICVMVKTQFGLNVKTIRSENGKELTSRPMKNFYAENRIVHQKSCVDTHNKMEGLKGSIGTS